jgi:hypothetical protein
LELDEFSFGIRTEEERTVVWSYDIEYKKVYVSFGDLSPPIFLLEEQRASLCIYLDS